MRVQEVLNIIVVVNIVNTIVVCRASVESHGQGDYTFNALSTDTVLKIWITIVRLLFVVDVRSLNQTSTRGKNLWMLLSKELLSYYSTKYIIWNLHEGNSSGFS